MANFQRKQIRFMHSGMNWNTPVEKLTEGQVCWAKNVRVLASSTVSAAHGHTQVFSSPVGFMHSISRMNIFNDLSNDLGKSDATKAFDPNLARTYVLGAAGKLLVFQDQATLSGANNPVITPLNRNSDGSLNTQDGFSGNPLSIVDAQPAGAAVAWKYIADSKQIVTTGYYPGDVKGTTVNNMARCLTIGIDPPVLPIDYPIFIEGTGQGISGGQLNGDYQWMFAYRRVQTGARSNPSAAARFQVGPGTVPTWHAADARARMTLPVAPMDPRTGLPDDNVMVDVYRFGGLIFRWALVGSGKGGTEFIDNKMDEQLLAAPSPPQATDATTGLTRFNLFRPFVTQDIQRHGFATLHRGSAGAYYLVPADGSLFNPHWVPGSTIYIGGPASVVGGPACSIYQIQNPNSLEIAEDLTGQIDSGAIGAVGNQVAWSIDAGTLMTGQPLSHIWGPYGIGQSGSYIFACGDPNARGTLYWTNGNDPDSTDIVNNIVVTSPSEKLVTGAIYDGQPYCWSTERQFQIFPSLTIFGQFTTQEVAGAKGCWLEWSLSVQSNGVSDQSVSWRGKDGIYDWSSQGLNRLTDPLYGFFPHDNNPGLAPETLMPFIGANSHHPEKVGNLDDTQPQYHRLCWFQGLLYYDFVCLDYAAQPGSGPVSTFSTLVWDTVNIPGGGWVSLDQPFSDLLHPVVRGIDIGANDPFLPIFPNDASIQVDPTAPQDGGIFGAMARGGSMKVLRSNFIYEYYGLVRGFESRFITGAEDLGDSRAQKRWGDYWLDCTPLNSFTVYPLCGFHRCALKPVDVPGVEITYTPDFCFPQTGERVQFILDFQEFKNNAGASLMSPTLGLDIIWQPADGQFAGTLNQWQPSYVLKPEVISFRASDPDDLGALQAKYFTGLNLEANTFGQNYLLNVLIDQTIVGTLQVNHNGQSEKPYAFPNTVGYETQLQMESPQIGGTAGIVPTWQLYKINWIYEVWPDSTTRDSFFTDLGYTGSKFLQGMVVPMETGGQPVTFNVNGDCGQKAVMGPVTTPAGCKMDLAFSFSPCNAVPSDVFIASSIQIVPNSPARIWYDNIKWIWEPEPELVPSWVTQPTDHDFATWHHHRDCFIAYRGGNGTPTLYITTEYSTEAYLLDPVTPGQYVRCYRVLKPQKAKWRSYRVEGCGLFRLYIKDCAVRVKEWGSTGPYLNAQPFGDMSRVNGAPGGAKI